MPLRVYGHWGVPILVFPCSLGRYYDYENMGMIDAIAFIDAGIIESSIALIASMPKAETYNFAVFLQNIEIIATANMKVI